jgi:PPM family protein phosphatase
MNNAAQLSGGGQAAPGATLEIEFAELSDMGRVRDHNDDYLGHLPPESAALARSHGWLFAVAGGAAGRDFGEIASREAVERVLAGFRDAPAGAPLPALLARIIRKANARIHEMGNEARPGGASLATTIVACAVRHQSAVVAHAGDSRCYLIRGGEARALTGGHTAAGAQQTGARHLVSRSLGDDLFVNVDTGEHQVLPGDILMLCSDGLHHSLEPEDIARVAGAGRDLNHTARQLVDVASARDGSDNMSVQLIRIRSVERAGMYRGRPYALR